MSSTPRFSEHTPIVQTFVLIDRRPARRRCAYMRIYRPSDIVAQALGLKESWVIQLVRIRMHVDAQQCVVKYSLPKKCNLIECLLIKSRFTYIHTHTYATTTTFRRARSFAALNVPSRPVPFRIKTLAFLAQGYGFDFDILPRQTPLSLLP